MTPTITEIKWEDIRKQAKTVNPALFEIADSLKMSKDLSMFLANYPYGCNLLEDGVLNLPSPSGKILPITHSEIPERIRDQLNYNSLPLGLILENGNEVYYESKEKLSSLAFFSPGVILGLWENMDEADSHFPRKIWKVSTGARTGLMLAKISDNIAHERLKNKYQIKIHPPRHFADHSKVFSAIVNSKNADCDWKNTIVFFGKDWLFGKKKAEIDKLKLFLLTEAWKLSSYNRNEATWDIIWSRFNNFLESKGIKGKPYYTYLVKHLVVTSMGVIPAFRPAGNLTVAAPIKEIQEAYLNVYGLKTRPVIMQPAHFNPNSTDGGSVYCSLQLPLLHNIFPKPLNNSTLLTDLKILQDTWNYFIEAALEGHLLIEHTPIKTVIDNVRFDFIHTDISTSHESEGNYTNSLIQADSLTSLDKALNISAAQCNLDKFPSNSIFLRGCVRISSILPNNKFAAVEKNSGV